MIITKQPNGSYKATCKGYSVDGTGQSHCEAMTNLLRIIGYWQSLK